MNTILSTIKLHKKLSIPITAVVILLLAGSTWYFTQGQQSKDPEQKRFEQVKQTQKTQLQSVGKQVKLPKGEDPIVATVSDRTALESQQFFKKAVNGDRVYMYPKAKKAYLYRPSEDRVIAVAPLKYGTTDTPQVAATSSANASGSAKLQ